MLVRRSTDYRYLGWDGYFDPKDTSLMNTPYMFSCPVPKEISSKVILAVSIVDAKCDVPSNALSVIHNKVRYRDN